MKSIKFTALTWIALSFCFLHAKASPLAATSLPDQVDALFADYDHPDSPGCALGIIQNGQFIHRKGYGQANLEYGLPITPDTVFRTGSVSKQFTALSVYLAEAQGKLDLDTDIHQYIPELPQYRKTITISHLTLENAPLPSTRLEPIFKDAFLLPGGSLLFIRDSSDRVTGFRLSSGGVQKLTFMKTGSR